MADLKLFFWHLLSDCICLQCTQSHPLIISENKLIYLTVGAIIICRFDVSKEQSAVDKKMRLHDQHRLHLNSLKRRLSWRFRPPLHCHFCGCFTHRHHSKSQGQRESSALHTCIANEGLSIRRESVCLTTNRARHDGWRDKSVKL